MMKNLYRCFCKKTQHSFILNYRGVAEGGDKAGLSKWSPGKIIKIT